jgi:hypothetical protein
MGSGPSSTNRRDRGKETFMNLSLRNMFGGGAGRSAARSTARPAGGAPLSVERLEERAVTAVNLVPYHFVLPNAGMLQVTSQDFQNDTFKGTFTDSHSGIVCQVSGQWTPVADNWDRISFQGSGHAWLEGETVQFNGWLLEAQVLDEVIPAEIEGRLTQNYVLFTSAYPNQDPHWSTTSFESAFNQLIWR